VSSSRKLRFDGWVLDPESGDLERGGTRVRLQEQPVQVLRELLAHAGSVVTREQLIALLWPKGVVDFDTGLNTVIRKLRSALGDTSETPRYIETLPRRGYRFIGALDPEPEAAPGASPEVAANHPGSPLAQPSASHPGPTQLTDAALSDLNSRPIATSPAQEATSSAATSTTAVRRPPSAALVLIAAVAVVALFASVYALWRARSGASITSVRVEALSQPELPANVVTAGAAAFSPPPHSVAVLPFVNISGDKEQEYFSDGLTEELLNSLAHIDGLQVAARTSSFSFREHPDIAFVGHKLNVATVLEGSVRRSGHTVRVSAQLVSAATGFHLWSNTYDRDLGDVLKLQTEIATAVASALKVTLLGDVGTRIELGGTRNPEAFDAYLRAAKAYEFAHDMRDAQTAVAAFGEAIRLDPKYALALAGRSIALTYAAAYAKDAEARQDEDQALADAREALAIAPELADGHLALHLFFEARTLDFAQAGAELARAVELAPGAAQVLGMYGRFAVLIGHNDAGIAAARRAVVLDPLNPLSHYRLGQALYFARRYLESIAAWNDTLALDPQEPDSRGVRGLAYYQLGELANARTSCEARPENLTSQWCLALTYQRLARRADAHAALAKLTAVPDAYRCATIYAEWGDAPQALEWLQTAMRLHDPELRWLKTDPLLDSVRGKPRFRSIERALKFPH